MDSAWFQHLLATTAQFQHLRAAAAHRLRSHSFSTWLRRHAIRAVSAPVDRRGMFVRVVLTERAVRVVRIVQTRGCVCVFVCQIIIHKNNTCLLCSIVKA